jgi:uncharacterized protein YdaU (DUF1376 family)
MAALPYMQLYVADYLADTAHLSAEENGAYLLLIFNYWQRGHALSNASERLANVARLPSERWAEIKPKLAEFFTIDGDTWTHDRIEADLAAVAAKSTKAKAAGATGGSKRVANAKQTLGERSTDADQTSSHTDTDTDTDTEDKSNPAGADLLGASKGATEGPTVDSLLADVSPQVVADFKRHRTAKKAPITVTALEGIQREAAKAGVTLERALATCCERGWQSFKADWYTGQQSAPAGPVPPRRKELA